MISHLTSSFEGKVDTPFLIFCLELKISQVTPQSYPGPVTATLPQAAQKMAVRHITHRKVMLYGTIALTEASTGGCRSEECQEPSVVSSPPSDREAFWGGRGQEKAGRGETGWGGRKMMVQIRVGMAAEVVTSCYLFIY